MLTEKVKAGLTKLYDYGYKENNQPGEAAGFFWVDSKELRENDGDVSKCEVNFDLIDHFEPYKGGELSPYPFSQKFKEFLKDPNNRNKIIVGMAHTHSVGFSHKPTENDYNPASLYPSSFYYGNTIVHHTGWYQIERNMQFPEFNQIY